MLPSNSTILKIPPILTSLFFSNTTPFILLHYLHDFRSKGTHKKNADKKIHRTELNYFNNYFHLDSPLQEVFSFFFFFLRRRNEWRKNISNQILESFKEERCQETTADEVTHSFQSGIQIIAQNLFKVAVHNFDKKPFPFCFFGLYLSNCLKWSPPDRGLHSGRQGSITKGVAKRHGSPLPCHFKFSPSCSSKLLSHPKGPFWVFQAFCRLSSLSLSLPSFLFLLLRSHASPSAQADPRLSRAPRRQTQTPTCL